MKRIKGVYVWFVLSVVLALAIPPLFIRAAPDGFEAYSRRVESMQQPERDRIERNFNEFLGMDEAQRNHYRDMHRRLEADVSEAQGVYAGQFDNYIVWLQTIPPHRQEELRRATDSRTRLALMHRILEEESDRETREAMETMFRDMPGPMRGWLRSRRHLLLETGRYRSLIEDVELKVDLSPSEREQLRSLTGVDRTFRFFELLQDESSDIPLSRALDAAEVRQVIDRAELDDLIDTLPDEARQRTQDRNLVLMMVLMTNVQREYQIEVHEHREPGEADLLSHLEELSAEDQDHLLQLPPDEFHRQLTERYAADIENLDINVVYRGMFGRDRRPGGGPPRGPAGGRPGGPRSEGTQGRPEFPRSPRGDRDGSGADRPTRRQGDGLPRD